MSRLIDADASIEKFTKEAQRTSDTSFAQALMYVVTCLDYAPTIEQPQWISVEERLPLYNERVLAYVCGRIEPLTLFYRDLLVEDYWEDDVQRVIILGAVTHWMPLPQSPKGDE